MYSRYSCLQCQWSETALKMTCTPTPKHRTQREMHGGLKQLRLIIFMYIYIYIYICRYVHIYIYIYIKHQLFPCVSCTAHVRVRSGRVSGRRPSKRPRIANRTEPSEIHGTTFTGHWFKKKNRITSYLFLKLAESWNWYKWWATTMEGFYTRLDSRVSAVRSAEKAYINLWHVCYTHMIGSDSVKLLIYLTQDTRSPRRRRRGSEGLRIYIYIYIYICIYT